MHVRWHLECPICRHLHRPWEFRHQTLHTHTTTTVGEAPHRTREDTHCPMMATHKGQHPRRTQPHVDARPCLRAPSRRVCVPVELRLGRLDRGPIPRRPPLVAGGAPLSAIRPARLGMLQVGEGVLHLVILILQRIEALLHLRRRGLVALGLRALVVAQD